LLGGSIAASNDTLIINALPDAPACTNERPIVDMLNVPSARGGEVHRVSFTNKRSQSIGMSGRPS